MFVEELEKVVEVIVEQRTVHLENGGICIFCCVLRTRCELVYTHSLAIIHMQDTNTIFTHNNTQAQ